MTGEKMNKIYAQILLNEKPELKTAEEKEFYSKLLKEIRGAEKGKKAIEWAIPAE